MTVLVLDTQREQSQSRCSQNTAELDLLFLAVEYQPGESRLNAAMLSRLREVSEQMRAEPKKALRLRCCERFPRLSPDADLDQDRCETVIRWLVNQGIVRARISLVAEHQVRLQAALTGKNLDFSESGSIDPALAGCSS